MQLQESGSATVLHLPELLDLAAAPRLAEELASARGSNVDLDATSVRHVGAQCAQVLLAAMDAWRTDGRKLRVIEGAPAFQEGIGLLGLEAKFAGETA